MRDRRPDKRVCDWAQPVSVVACDPSQPFIEHARHEVDDPRISFEVAGAGNLPRRADGFDAVISGLVLNFLPMPGEALEQMRERARPGGEVAAYVWDYASGMEPLRFFWEEAVRLDPESRGLDEGIRFPMCHRDALEAMFREADLRDVRSEALETVTRFDEFADYWTPFLAGIGPAPGYVSSLDPERRDLLRESLRHRLVTDADGSIHLKARAWVARGTAP
jgi:SAM-dependent methyltransferase